MKNYTTIKILLTVAILVYSLSAYCQSNIEVIIKNDEQVAANQYEFDVYLVVTGGSPFEMSLHQYGINYNPAIKNGGTLTAEWLPGTSEINIDQLQSTINTSSNSSQLRIATKSTSGPGSGTIITSSSPKRVGRLRLTNSVPFASVTPDITFSFTASSSSTRCGVSWYDGTKNTPFCSPNIASGCKGNAVYTVQMNNPILNAPTSRTINIFPNPATDKVVIQADGISSIMLYDINGTVIQAQKYKSEYQIDLRLKYPPGNYFIEIVGEDWREVRKLVIAE